jgi:hypothetical protein
MRQRLHRRRMVVRQTSGGHTVNTLITVLVIIAIVIVILAVLGRV